jgi:TRAP-type C4-dicarboxylate transport system substrate-binding protein
MAILNIHQLWDSDPKIRKEKPMKKRILVSALALVILVSLVLTGCSTSSSPASGKTTSAPTATSAAPAASTTQSAANIIKLKYADQNPPTGWEGSQAAQPWLDQITKATSGRVQFETYYSQSLFKGTDAWASTKSGVADLAWMFHGYWGNMTPLADVLSLPMMPFTSAKQASGIFWQLYEKYPTLAAQFKDNHVLTTWTSQPYFLITSKKQVKVMDDWKGLKIRVTAGPPVDMMKALGATPVTMGMPDTYLALQKGDIDGMLGPWEAFISFRQYEVVKYYTYAPLVTVYFTQGMNNSKWDSLPADVKTQINSVSQLKGSLFWGENMFDTAVIAGRDQVKKQGAEMIEYTVPADEMAKWAAVAGQPLWDAWVKAQTDAGRPEARDILNTTVDLIKTYKP